MVFEGIYGVGRFQGKLLQATTHTKKTINKRTTPYKGIPCSVIKTTQRQNGIEVKKKGIIEKSFLQFLHASSPRIGQFSQYRYVESVVITV